MMVRREIRGYRGEGDEWWAVGGGEFGGCGGGGGGDLGIEWKGQSKSRGRGAGGGIAVK